MSKKLILVLMGIIFFFGFNLASANVIINEVAWMGTTTSQYEEWIELKNTGSESVSLVGWKLYKNSGTLLFSLSKTISAGDYFIVCRTTPSVPDPLLGICDEQGIFGGSGLNNMSDLVQLKNASDIEVDLVDGTSVAGWPAGDATTKETMQKSGLNWITALPTPGTENKLSSFATYTSGGPLENNGNTEISSSFSSVVSSSVETTQKQNIRTNIVVKNISFVGVPLSFQVTAFGYAGEELHSGKYFWNFGDGSSMEVTNDTSFSHNYFYPGDYVVSLSYYLNPYSQIPDVVNKVKIKVVPLQLSISNVGDVQDFFVELFNNSGYDMDLSNWSLSSNGKNFSFPRDTNILAKNKIILSSQITNLNFEDKNNLKLLSPLGKIISQFYENPEIAKQVPEIKIEIKNEKINSEINNNTNSTAVGILEEKIPAENLTSLAINTEAASALPTNEKENSSNFYIFSIILFIFLSFSGGAVYFLRRKSGFSMAGDDFDILEE